MDVKIKQISTPEALIVRAPVLRKNQPAEWASMKEDNLPNTIHYGGFINKKIVGTATIYPENRVNKNDEWRLRGMAVLNNYQSKGIGEQLLTSCFKFIKSKNGKIFWCNARIGAINFYKKYGFLICSEEFNIPKIGPHFVMEKIL